MPHKFNQGSKKPVIEAGIRYLPGNRRAKGNPAIDWFKQYQTG